MNKVLSKINSAIRSVRWINQVFSKNKITKSDALKIQRDTYDERRKCKRNDYDRTYLEIVDFLKAKEYEVFCSAVLNLENMAINNHAQKAKILAILRKTAADKTLPEAHKKYLAKALDEIEN